LNIENNDDSYSLMFLKGSYCKTMESPLFHWDLYNKLLACLNILYIYEFYNTHILNNEFMKKFEEQVNSRIDKVEHNLDKYTR
jgi:N-glycosylase/DNA lyase